MEDFRERIWTLERESEGKFRIFLETWNQGRKDVSTCEISFLVNLFSWLCVEKKFKGWRREEGMWYQGRKRRNLCLEIKFEEEIQWNCKEVAS